MKMRKTSIKIFSMLLLAACGTCDTWGASIDSAVMKDRSDDTGGGHIRVLNVSAARIGGMMTVSMDIDMSEVKIKSGMEEIMVPVMSREGDTVKFQPVVVAGRNRYYHFLRKNHSLPDSAAMLFRSNDKVRTARYTAQVPYEGWMAKASLDVEWERGGCCTEKETGMYPLFRPKTYSPNFIYVTPEAQEVKEDSAERTAHIIFIVDKTDINYKRPENVVELDRICRTIDSLKNDKDYTVTSLTVKGYASPESPYAHNTDLANGRTKTLKEYIVKHCGFSYEAVSTSAEPEDWVGLRKYVEGSYLENRDGILALIDSNMDPDRKEDLIKRTFPNDYRFLLKNVYPDLRRSEYKVRYRIRKFTDIEEIRRMMRTEPHKLSLNEMYMVVKDMKAGSEEFAEAFQIAVAMFPNDPVANINAANAAMERGDFETAGRCLDKAGSSPEAVYARGVHAAMNERYAEAENMFKVAAGAGVAGAAEALEQVRDIMEHNISVK